MTSRQRAALGQIASLGTLYDARLDTFLPFNLMSGDISTEITSTVEMWDIQTDITTSDSFAEKLKMMNIDSDLAVSLLINKVPHHGLGLHAVTQASRTQAVTATLYHTTTVKHEKLNLQAGHFQTVVDVPSLSTNPATHFVAGICSGRQTIIVGQQDLDDESHRDFCNDLLNGHLRGLQALMDSNNTTGGSKHTESETTAECVTPSGPNAATYDVYTNLLKDNGHASALSHRDVQLLLKKLKTDEGGVLGPISYSLLPIPLLRYVITAPFPSKRMPPPADKSPWLPFVTLYEEWCSVIANIERLVHHGQSSSVGEGTVSQPPGTQKALNVAIVSQNHFVQRLATAVQKFRAGKLESCQISSMLDDLSAGSQSPNAVQSMLDTRPTETPVDFQVNFIEKGGILFSPDEMESAVENGKHLKVLLHDAESREDQQTWAENQRLILEALSIVDGSQVALCDLTGHEPPLQASCIRHFRDGEIVSHEFETLEDVVEETPCYAMYDQAKLDTPGAPLPRDRRPVEIPCPSGRCSKHSPRTWFCQTCDEKLEYAESYIYCKCGRASYNAFRFKCGAGTHTANFIKYRDNLLKFHLDNLKEYTETNILILGETGVGKSTFINAFFNYILFESLEDAMAHEKLEHLVSCSFSMQHRDDDGLFVQYDIKIGTDDSDEKDGSSGESATQMPKVYRLALGNHVIRFIDTPGIGDTRGVDQDQENMQNILATVGQQDKIHGILILLKPNMSRLTLMFRYCVNDLLTHLHRDAARNMVFGFTNTRQTNYMPGDSFKPLDTLLRKHDSVDISLNHERVYCFDSESFRFLAALKENGVEMPNMEDFGRSWQRSVLETRRLLNHFTSLVPHATKTTLSLNSVRQMITGLTKPLADIARVIESTIRLNEQNIEELQEMECRGKELLKRVSFDKLIIETTRLSRPRTVCRHADCVAIRNIGNNELRTVYKTICHDGCTVRNVQGEVIGHPNIRHCSVLADRAACRTCDHQWQDHLHLHHDQQEKIIHDTDPDIARQMQANSSDADLKQQVIDSMTQRVETTKQQGQTIRDAAVRFGLFLKANSITPYNDGMIACIDQQIKEQRQVVQHARAENLSGAEKTEQQLSRLQQFKDEYTERVKILEEQRTSDGNSIVPDEATIKDILEDLYAIPTWGENLRSLQLATECSRAALYQEENYGVRPAVHWTAAFAGPESSDDELAEPAPRSSSNRAHARMHQGRRGQSSVVDLTRDPGDTRQTTGDVDETSPTYRRAYEHALRTVQHQQSQSRALNPQQSMGRRLRGSGPPATLENSAPATRKRKRKSGSSFWSRMTKGLFR